MQSSYIHGLKVCRRLEYHVNPTSESILELGTRTHPYKNINLPLLEMFNFISGMNKTVKVKLAKSSDHYLMHSFGAISNITSVVFEPYNSNKKTASTDEYGKKNFEEYYYRLFNKSECHH